MKQERKVVWSLNLALWIILGIAWAVRLTYGMSQGGILPPWLSNVMTSDEGRFLIYATLICMLAALVGCVMRWSMTHSPSAHTKAEPGSPSTTKVSDDDRQDYMDKAA